MIVSNERWATVICFASAKGGSGKTVTCSSFGHILVHLGKKVLLIDTDAATNGMSLLFLGNSKSQSLILGTRGETGTEVRLGLFEAAEDDGAVEPSIFPITDGLDMLPATYVTKQTDRVDPFLMGQLLKESIQKLRPEYDYILLDCQAGTDQFALNTIENADHVVIVTEYDYISSLGVARMQQLFPNHFAPEKTWTLFNKMLPELAPEIGQFLSIARYLSPIHWDADVVRAFAQGQLAINMNSPNPYTLAVSDTMDSLLTSSIHSEIELWKKDKEESVRAPAREQLAVIDDNLVEIQSQLDWSRERIIRLKARFRAYLVSGMISSVLLFVWGYLILSQVFEFYAPIETLTLTGVVIASAIGIAAYVLLRWRARWEFQAAIEQSEVYNMELQIEDLRSQRQILRVRSGSRIGTRQD